MHLNPNKIYVFETRNHVIDPSKPQSVVLNPKAFHQTPITGKPSAKANLLDTPHPSAGPETNPCPRANSMSCGWFLCMRSPNYNNKWVVTPQFRAFMLTKCLAFMPFYGLQSHKFGVKNMWGFASKNCGRMASVPKKHD